MPLFLRFHFCFSFCLSCLDILLSLTIFFLLQKDFCNYFLHYQILRLPEIFWIFFYNIRSDYEKERIKDYEERISQIKIFGHFLSRGLLKKISEKLLVSKNTSHLLENKFSRNTYIKRKITRSKASHYSFLDYLVLSHLIFQRVFVNLKTTNSISSKKYMFYLNKPQNVIKKSLGTHKKNVYRALM